MDLGEAIRLRRTQLGMSQAELARAADVDARQIRR
jgi:transcriptional regulator with XRE-family HTH domain